MLFHSRNRLLKASRTTRAIQFIRSSYLWRQTYLLGRFHATRVWKRWRLEQKLTNGDAGLTKNSFVSAWIRSAANAWALLGINATDSNFLASAFMDLLKSTLQQVRCFWRLMPLFASIGGIADQTLTLIVRGLVTGRLLRANFKVSMPQHLNSRSFERNFVVYCE